MLPIFMGRNLGDFERVNVTQLITKLLAFFNIPSFPYYSLSLSNWGCRHIHAVFGLKFN